MDPVTSVVENVIGLHHPCTLSPKEIQRLLCLCTVGYCWWWWCFLIERLECDDDDDVSDRKIRMWWWWDPNDDDVVLSKYDDDDVLIERSEYDEKLMLEYHDVRLMMFLIERSEANDNDDYDWKIRVWWWWYFDTDILMMMMLMVWWCF